MPKGVYTRALRNPADVFAERFEAEPNSGCWIWTGTRNSQGYGRMRAWGEERYAHRVSWELHRGPIGSSQEVCHRCDTPLCVNPDHLFLGTHAENLRDMRAKGRHAHGPGRFAKRLNALDVYLIRLAANLLPISNCAIARTWRVTHQYVWAIVRNRSWVEA